MKLLSRILLAAIGLFLVSSVTVFGQSTVITYQGRLNSNGGAANGTYDMTFQLFTAGSGGGSVGTTLTSSGTAVSNGLFTVTLDFGNAVFNGTSYWLQIGVRTNGAGSFTSLSPRQEVTAAPYAIYANTVGAVANAALPVNPTFSGTITANNYLGNGANLTGITATTLDGKSAANFWQTTGNSGTSPGSGNFLGTLDNQPLEFWVNGMRMLRLDPSGNIIGGTNNNIQLPAFNALIGGGSLNQIGTGSDQSVISGGAYNSIESGAARSTIVGGYTNVIQSAAVDSTIVGGAFNAIQNGSFESTIAGGYGNRIQTNSYNSTIDGGYFNIIQTGSYNATIAGGYLNNIQPDAFGATISGGIFNSNQNGAAFSTIGGGELNSILANATYSTIPGGLSNSVAAPFSFAAGHRARANTTGSFVWADSQNTDFSSTANNQFIIRAAGGVGIGNSNPGAALDVSGTVRAVTFVGDGSGLTNLNVTVINTNGGGGGSSGPFVGDGSGLTNVNAAKLNGLTDANFWKTGGNAGTVPGTQFLGTTDNQPLEIRAAGGVGIGNANPSSALDVSGTVRAIAFIGDGSGLTNLNVSGGGGGNNSWNTTGNAGTVAGTQFLGTTDNQPLEIKVNGARALRLEPADGVSPNVIAGAAQNSVDAGNVGVTIGGGLGNEVTSGSDYSIISGGTNNTISSGGTFGVIAGGRNNSATSFAFAAGDGAQAGNTGSFVWSGAAGIPTASTINYSVTMRALGGYRFFTGTGNAGTQLAANGTSWQTISDRNQKKNIVTIDGETVLDKLAGVPISKWNYKWEKDSDTPNIGPMAQDFKKTFYPGRDDKAISTLEFDGVELAAIQGLNEKLEKEQSDNAELKKEISDLKQMMNALNQKIEHAK